MHRRCFIYKVGAVVENRGRCLQRFAEVIPQASCEAGRIWSANLILVGDSGVRELRELDF